jgi:hypothetical protein
MRLNSIVDCCDLYDNAAEKLKMLDNDIDKTIQDLSKDVVARGVPKNKVARQVVKELSAREVLSPSRIYKGLGIEQKRKYKKKVPEETFPRVENIHAEKSSTKPQIVLTAYGTGDSETLKDMNGGSDIKLVSEEQKKKGAPIMVDERLREKEKEIVYLRGYIEEIRKQLADKTEEASRLRRDKEALKEKTQPELFREMQEKFYDEPGLLKGDTLKRVNEAAGQNLVKMLERYNSILNDPTRGQPIPVGLYVIAKPEMVFVPVRFTVDFGMQRVDISLWEKKLQGPP